MNPDAGAERTHTDTKVDVKLRLSALWITVMFCCVYADILGFYDKELLAEIMKGNMGPLGPITQELKLGVAVMMSIPAIMVFLCLALKRRLGRWVNIIAGALFTVIILITLSMNPWIYYIYFGILEVLITSFIVWLAWKCPVNAI